MLESFLDADGNFFRPAARSAAEFRSRGPAMEEPEGQRALPDRPVPHDLGHTHAARQLARSVPVQGVSVRSGLVNPAVKPVPVRPPRWFRLAPPC